MEDTRIIDLYWSRSEAAIYETDIKYRGYCFSIAFHILYNKEDSEECLNDTYHAAWNAMPPQRPNNLKTFLGKLTRNLSLHKWEYYQADKRGGNQVNLALEELEGVIGVNDQDVVDQVALKDLLNDFLKKLKPDARKFFVRRYWYMDSIEEIAQLYGVSQSKVKMSLLRTRHQLKDVLESEGFSI
ncbi:MAG: sigma-70 family RNA polymerase sigma factor [Erysipelotrichaceae bacterium]|nr:sigma-70 family RNA polymerase sigma factor [Erysipelotrichaceae bacterium]